MANSIAEIFERYRQRGVIVDNNLLLLYTIGTHKEAAVSEGFRTYGLTDTGIVDDARKANVLVLTDDLQLSGYLHSTGMDVINFNHIRTF